MEADLIKFVVEAERLGLVWAEAQSLYDQLDDLKKSVLAQSMPKEGSQSAKEEQALKSEAYLNHLKGLSAARRDALMSKVRYGASNAKIDALRTILSNKREHAKRGIL